MTRKLIIPGKGGAGSPTSEPCPHIPGPQAPEPARLVVPGVKIGGLVVPKGSGAPLIQVKPVAPVAPVGFSIAPPRLSGGPVSGSDELDRMASQTVSAAKRGLMSQSAAYSRDRVQAAVSIGSKLVGALRGQAIKSARADQTSTVDAGAVAQVWQSLVEMLQADSLLPVIYCARSGRPVQMLSPESLHDFCAAIAKLGDSQTADLAMVRLYEGTIRQMAASVMPQYLTVSADSLAIERELLPVDFLIRGIGKLFPAPADTDFLARAQWVAKLAALRADADKLPIPVLHFLCEIITLHLAHIDARTMPHVLRLSALFPGGDWSQCLGSVAAAGHLAARLVQHIFGLLASRENKPVERLSRFDLLHLRTAYRGHSEYSGNYRRSRQQVATTAKYALRGDVSSATWALADHISNELALDFGMADLLDLQAAAALTGRAVSVHVQTPAEVERAQKVRASTVRKAAQAAYGLDADEPAAIDDLAGLDLSGLMAADLLPEDFITIDSEADLVAMGLITADEAEDLDLWGIDDDENEPEEIALSWADADAMQSDILAATIEAAMSGMKPLKP